MKGAMGRLWWETVGVGLCEFSGQLLRAETETVDWFLMLVLRSVSMPQDRNGALRCERGRMKGLHHFSSQVFVFAS